MDRGCSNCYYGTFDGKAYPCSLCIRGIPREDMWHPMLLQQKTDTPQTERACNNCGRDKAMCLYCEERSEWTPQTAQKIAEFQKLCGIKIDPDRMNIDCGWK